MNSLFRIRALAVIGSILIPFLLSGCSSLNTSAKDFSEQIAMQRQQGEQDTPSLDNKAVYLDMIKKMQDTSMYFASLAHIDAYQKTYGSSPDIQLLRANALRETGQAALAEAQYRQLLQTSTSGAAWHGLGLLAAKQGNFSIAATDFREAVLREPTNATMLSDLGYALLQVGDTSAARVPLMQAAELAPSNRKVISNLALYLMVSGESDKARAVITQAKISDEISTEIFRQADDLNKKNMRMEYLNAKPIAQTAQAINTDGTVQLQLQRSLLMVVPATEAKE